MAAKGKNKLKSRKAVHRSSIFPFIETKSSTDSIVAAKVTIKKYPVPEIPKYLCPIKAIEFLQKILITSFFQTLQ